MMMRSCAALLAAVVLAPVALHAQTCGGQTSFSVAPAQVAARVAFTDGATTYGGGLAFGGARGFAGANVNHTRFSSIDAGGTSIGFGGGLEFAPSKSSSIRWCPVAQVYAGFGPDERRPSGATVKNSSTGLGAGVSIGGERRVREGLVLVPSLSGLVAHDRAKATLGERSVTGTDTGGLLQGVIGLRVQETVTIVPAVTIPVGFTVNDPVYNLGVVIGFKRR